MHMLRARLLLTPVLLVSLAKAAGSADLMLLNVSGATLDQFYISPCGTRDWGPNQLAGVRLWSSKSFIVSDIVPGCYDLKLIIPPWNECMVSGVALRRDMLWNITWSTVELSNYGDCSTAPHIAPIGRRPVLEGQ